MKLSILGIIVGGGLFAGGFVVHDTDYSLTQFTHPVSGDPVWEASNIWPHAHSPSDNWEHLGWLMGVTGAAILTMSIDRMQNLDKTVQKAESRFRTKWGMLVGAGAIVGGHFLHERGEDDELQLVASRYYNGPVQWIDARNNPREHLGYFLSAAGASWFTYSAR